MLRKIRLSCTMVSVCCSVWRKTRFLRTNVSCATHCLLCRVSLSLGLESLSLCLASLSNSTNQYQRVLRHTLPTLSCVSFTRQFLSLSRSLLRHFQTVPISTNVSCAAQCWYKCCSVLQCVAVCCSVLPCVAVCCRVQTQTQTQTRHI